MGLIEKIRKHVRLFVVLMIAIIIGIFLYLTSGIGKMYTPYE